MVFVSFFRLLITFIDSVYVFENECKRIFRNFFAIIVINTNLCGRSKMDTFSQFKYGVGFEREKQWVDQSTVDWLAVCDSHR